MSNRDIERFVYKQLKEESELANKLIHSIKVPKDAKYIKSFLTNPLLLSLYILTFQSNAKIPSKKSIFYQRVIQALFSEHDSRSKLGFVREKSSKLTQEEFEAVLQRFSLVSYFAGRYEFKYDYVRGLFEKIKGRLGGVSFNNMNVISDLKLSISLWVEDEGVYSFSHRSLQEYYAAAYIKGLNDEQKKNIYPKILNKIVSPSKNEIHNFLSVLKEIDEINFIHQIEIKLLERLLQPYRNTSVLAKIEVSLLLLFEGFEAIKYQEEGTETCNVWVDKDKLEQFAFIEEVFEFAKVIRSELEELILKDELYTLLSEGSYIPDFSHKEERNGIYPTYGLDFTSQKDKYEKKIPKKALLIIKESRIKKIVLHYVGEFEKRLRKSKMKINRHISNNDDFIDMI